MHKASTPVDPGENPSETTIPWSAFVKFLSQFSHDIRNGLNAIELELTLAAEICSDPETVEEIRRARKSVANLAHKIQDARGKTSEPMITHVTYKLTEFAEDLTSSLKQRFPDSAEDIHFANVPSAEMEVDPTQLIIAFNNLLENSLHFRAPGTPIIFRVEVTETEAEFQIVQETADEMPENVDSWGKTPLLSTRRAGYGLGLHQAIQIIRAHGGRIDFVNNTEKHTLATCVFLPFKAAGTPK